MTEEFLQFIWKFRLFNNHNLQTECGSFIEIQNTGFQNTDAGPDFFNAKIKIGDTLWAGNIEVHIKASDWLKHGHQKNEAYNNVILHVVFNNDQRISRFNSKEAIPTLVLDGNIQEHMYNNYLEILNAKEWIPCAKLINSIDSFYINSWLERLLVERLERKSNEIKGTIALNKNNWEQTFYEYVARNFGFKINDLPFELLAKSLPQKYLAKHRNNPFQLEAMLLGQAGLLNNNFSDDYPNLLKKEYSFLSTKFSLQPIKSHLWKFMRTRPVNFPTIRISQFADLISKSSGLFASIVEAEKIKDIEDLFDISSASYWDTHYLFDKQTPYLKKNFGQDSIRSIIINTVVPFLFAYSINKGKDQLKQRALDFLYQTKKESNSIIKNWASIGIEAKNAFTTQALIELKNNYCSDKKCLSCYIGNKLIKDHS